MSYQVFTRTWWRWDGTKRVPHAGKRTIIGYADTEDEARGMCKEYNDNHDAGQLSRKAEYTSRW